MQTSEIKILVPLSRAEHLEPYLEAGADELYMGFRDAEWERRFGAYADLNRMSGFGKRANPNTFPELLELVGRIRRSGRKAFVTLNANGYSVPQIRYLEEYIFPFLHEAGTDGIITSDLGLIHAAHRQGLPTVASTMCAIYNADIAQIYRDAGVRRMILPRDLSLAELEEICRGLPDIEFEAFFMRNGCIFSDCYCLGLHRPECGATCTYHRFAGHRLQHEYTSFAEIHALDLNEYLYNTSLHREACGMCALWRLREAGITALKIVGRADDHQSVLHDIADTRYNLEVLHSAKCEQDYLEKMRYPGHYPERCRLGLNCYYPEVRFGETGWRKEAAT